MANSTTAYFLDPAVTPVYRGIYSTISLLMIIFGVLGNLLVCLAISRIRRFRNTINMLIMNLATADILQCINIFSMFITLLKGEWIFGDFLCNANAFLMIGLVTASVYSLVAIGVNRYVVIYHCEKYFKIFSRRNTKFVIIVVWFIAFASSLPPLFGWGKFTFAPRRGFCILDFKLSLTYTITMSTTVLLLPFLVIVIVYFRICVAVKRRKMRLSKVGPDKEVHECRTSSQSTPSRYRIQKMEAFSTSIMLFVVTFLFVVIYVPTMVFNFLIMIGHNPMPVGMDIGFVLLALANHVINPVIYGVMNKNYRVSLKMVLKNCFK